MAILNYTTTIDVEKTAMEIQKKLAKAGAKAVLCEYDEEVMSAMSFQVMTPHGLTYFRMPARIDGVYRSLHKNPKVPKRLVSREQASRVAWRILKDWIEAQLAIVEAEMAELAEVFLPFAQDTNGQTLYERVRDSGFKGIAHQSNKES